MDWLDGTIALLCLLAAAALPARVGVRDADVPGLLIGFAAGAVMLAGAARAGTAPATTAAIALAAWSTAELLWTPGPRASMAAAGVATGAAASLYTALAAPAWLAFPVAFAVPCAAFLLARRGALIDGRLRDEALVGLTWAAVLGAVGPTLVAGWHSAVQLNRQAGGGAAEAASGWVWTFIALAAATGLLRGWWIRK